MGIKDYKKFWEDLENNHTLIQNELQVSNGLKSILQNIKIKNLLGMIPALNQIIKKR